MELGRGMRVPDMEGVHECYEVLDKKRYQSFCVNIGVGKLTLLLRRFCAELGERSYFILELPTNAKDEAMMGCGEGDALHRDVYYLPDLDRQGMWALLDEYGELLMHDGLVRFGFASMDSKDEIFVTGYNTTYLFALTREQACRRLLAELSIPEEPEIRVVQSTFSAEMPGDSCAIEVDGCRIYDLPDRLMGRGLFFAKRVKAE